MANKKSRFTRTRIQAALVWHSVRTVARAPPWKYVTNAAAVREAPRTSRGFRFSSRTIIGVRQIASTFRCRTSMREFRRSGRKDVRPISPCGSARSRTGELRHVAKTAVATALFKHRLAEQTGPDRARARLPIRPVKAQLPTKQRGSPALPFSGLGPRDRKRPPLFAETPESCQAKSEPCGTKSAYPLGAGLD